MIDDATQAMCDHEKDAEDTEQQAGGGIRKFDTYEEFKIEVSDFFARNKSA